MQAQPSSEHLGLFSLCFLASVVSAAAVAVTHAFNKVCGLSSDVTDTSKAAVLPMTQLHGISISAGRVFLWLGVRLLNLYPYSNVGTATHFHNAVTKSAVSGDHISSMFTCDCMMA